MERKIFGKQVVVKTELVVIAGAVLILLGCLAGYIFLRDSSDIIIESDSSVTTATSAAISGILSQTTGTSVTALEQIKVYVVGCVNKPGIVTMDKGKVIDDAVRLAGGLTKEADADNINMVYKLNENTMLYIKSKKDLVPVQDESVKNPVLKAAATKNIKAKDTEMGILGKGAEILNNSGSSVEVIGSDGGSIGNGIGAEDSGIININTADTAELDKLPGVGEATAREIIAYREKNGPYRKIEDIMKVPRIKQGRFNSIKDLIGVN